LQSRPSAATIESVEKDAARVRVPFAAGAMVVLTLSAPREKFWGMILALTPEGLSLSGIELASFEDLVVMVKDGEPFTPAVVFFPMHRIERIDLDVPDGNLPSLSQRFAAKTGQEPSTFLPFTGANQMVNRRDTAPAESSVDKEPA
jgi:hypothetical protein